MFSPLFLFLSEVQEGVYNLALRGRKQKPSSEKKKRNCSSWGTSQSDVVCAQCVHITGTQASMLLWVEVRWDWISRNTHNPADNTPGWKTGPTVTPTSFSAAVFSTNLEPWPGLPGQWMVIPGKKKSFCSIQDQLHPPPNTLDSNQTVEIFDWACYILTPGVPLSVKHSEGLARVGQT